MSTSPRYGHRSLPQMHACVTRTIASVGSRRAASGTCSTRTSRVPWKTVARTGSSFCLVRAEASERFVAGDRLPDDQHVGVVGSLVGVGPLDVRQVCHDLALEQDPVAAEKVARGGGDRTAFVVLFILSIE